MQRKIIYLKPHSSFRAAMRSDTLWGACCWGMRLLYGKGYLEAFLESYQTPDTDVKPFYISSAFPFLEKNNQRIPFLPPPVRQVEYYKESAGKSYEEEKQQMRRWKTAGDNQWLSKAQFEYAFCGITPAPKQLVGHPAIEVRPMTHNTIDRLVGSTLTANNRGQLFHTEERYVLEKERKQNAGLYFLAAGNTDLLESVLRLLEHLGIGGDRSIGKGRFDMEWEDFDIHEPSDANGLMALSLYHPNPEELLKLEKSQDPVLNYKTIVRQGWKAAHNKKPVLYLEEGSVIPILSDKQVWGRNAYAGEHEQGYPITQYGHGFMIKVKIPTHEN